MCNASLGHWHPCLEKDLSITFSLFSVILSMKVYTYKKTKGTKVVKTVLEVSILISFYFPPPPFLFCLLTLTDRKGENNPNPQPLFLVFSMSFFVGKFFKVFMTF